MSRLRSAGFDVVAHDDVFEQGTSDADWLAEAGRRGWVVLTKDQAIRYSAAELSALKRARVRQFVLASGNLTAEQMADAFVRARRRMDTLVARRSGPFVARVTKDGKVSRVQELST